jgi:FkbM family methyltransferase
MVPLLRFVGRLAKPVLSRTIYRPGTVATILFGPAKGLKYKIFPGYGLSMLYGGWEPELHRVMASYVAPGDVAYDLGANFGIFTTFLARLVGPSGHVYAFEPLPHIMSELRANVASNGQTNVEFVPAAVADEVGTATFHLGHQLGSGHLGADTHWHPDAGEPVSVPVVTLDDVVARGSRPPTFLKMDIEGAEGAALAGARTLLRTHRPVLAIEVHSPELGDRVGEILEAERYRAWRVDLGMAPVTRMTGGGLSAEGMCGFVLALPAERTDTPETKGLI